MAEKKLSNGEAGAYPLVEEGPAKQGVPIKPVDVSPIPLAEDGQRVFPIPGSKTEQQDDDAAKATAEIISGLTETQEDIPIPQEILEPQQIPGPQPPVKDLEFLPKTESLQMLGRTTQEKWSSNFKKRVNVETKRRLDKKEMSEAQFREREMPEIEEQIKQEYKEQARQIIAKSGEGARLLKLDEEAERKGKQSAEFEKYVAKKIGKSGLEPDEFYDMVCRGVRVDLYEEKPVIFGLLGTRHVVPFENKDGFSYLSLKEDDLDGFIAEQKKYQEAILKEESEKRFAVKLAIGRDKLRKSRAKTARQLVDAMLVKPKEEPIETAEFDDPENQEDQPRYDYLKEQEKAGKLTSEEFEEVLEIDFKRSSQDKPAFAGEFNPEQELKAALISTKESPRGDKKTVSERRKATEAFKEKLELQRQGLADCRLFIEKEIEFNNDVSKEKLMSWVEKFKEQYGFTKEQQEKIEEVIDGYYERHEKVKQLRAQFPNDFELIKHVTGVNFREESKNDFKVTIGPMSIDIETNDEHTMVVRNRATNPILTVTTGGFAKASPKDQLVYFTVTNTESPRIQQRKEAKQEITKHEQVHVKNQLLHAVFEDLYNAKERNELRNKYLKEKEEAGYSEKETEEPALKEYFIAERDEAFSRAKDEIIAMLEDTPLTSLAKKVERLLLSDKDSKYDYLQNVRPGGSLNKPTKMYKKMVQEMLVDQYNDTLKKATVSLLELIKKGKYSKEKAVALLTDRSLSEWPKTVKRILPKELKIKKK